MTNPNASRAGIWRDAFQIFPDLWAFLKQPTVDEPTYIWTPLIWRQLFLLFLFDIVLILPIYIYFVGYEELLLLIGVPPPDHTGYDDYDNVWRLWLFMGLMAPLLEEPLFRGWLRGTPRQLLMLAVALGTLAALFAIERFNDLSPWALTFLFVALLVAVVTALLEIDTRTRPNSMTIPLFERHFQTIFWTSVALFGLVHVTNYTDGPLWAIIPMILPQLLIAPVWAFARLRFGLRASILLHSASNSILVPLIALSSS